MNYKRIVFAAGLLVSGFFVLSGQPPEEKAAIFTAAQAEAGRVAFENTCGQCHTPTLTGRKGEPGEVPALTSLSPAYQKFIGPRGYVPPAGMNDQTSVNITAYVLQANGATAGTTPLTRSTGALVRAVTR